MQVVSVALCGYKYRIAAILKHIEEKIVKNPRNSLVSASLGKAGALVCAAATGLLGTAAGLSLFLRRGRAAQGRMRFLTAILGVTAAIVPAAAQTPLAAGSPGVALSETQVLSVALPITNISTVTLSSVTVTSAQLGSLPVVSTTLPVNLGDLAAGTAATFDVNFDASSVPAGVIGTLTVQGTFMVNGVTVPFTVQHAVGKPQASTQSQSASVPAQQPTGAPYPPSLPPWPEEPNEDTTPAAPTGPSRPMPAPPASDIENLGNIPTAPGIERPMALTSPLQVTVSKNFGTTINASGWPLDPNAATKGNVVLVTHNTFLEYSTDGGKTFLELDPTTIFPNYGPRGNLIDGGLCCDQAVVYVPSINRFVWLMQFWAGKTTNKNRDRLAAASPADLLKAGCVGTGCSFTLKTFADAWTYWDLTSDTFSLGAHWMDYPDLSTGTNFLYMSTDPGGGSLTVRIPLSQIAASTTINIDYINIAGNFPTRVTRNTGTEAYWAVHNSTSQMKIFSWAEGSNLIYSRPANVASWYSPTTNAYSSLTPDNQNWVSFLQGHVPGDAPVGATVNGNDIWFAWTAPAAPGIPYTHIRLAQINRTNFSVIANDAIWNQNYAYAYGFLNTNSNGEVGMSYAWGGVSQYVNSAVAFLTGTRHFWGTAVGDIGTGRYCDFLGIRVDSVNTKCFVTAGMAVNSSSGRTYGDLVYSLFGRQGDCAAGQ
jgi:hypothetical protein